MVKSWMLKHVSEYEDPRTGEINVTALAEGAAYAEERPEWLGDETHPVWDWALEVAEDYEGESSSDLKPNARGKTVVIEALVPLEEHWDGRWHARLTERDYYALVDLCDNYGVHLLIAALAQIAEDQKWMTKREALELAGRTADELMDKWQGDAELSRERSLDR
jgi:hypothetical protein